MAIRMSRGGASMRQAEERNGGSERQSGDMPRANVRPKALDEKAISDRQT